MKKKQKWNKKVPIEFGRALLRLWLWSNFSIQKKWSKLLILIRKTIWSCTSCDREIVEQIFVDANNS